MVPGSRKRIVAPSSASFFDHPFFPYISGGIALALLGALIYFIDIFPDYSHVRVKIFSGPRAGYYFEKVEEARRIAGKQKGVVENIPTMGSLDNVERLLKTGDRRAFALTQDGIPETKGIQLVAYLPTHETLFILGRGADRIRSLGDLKGLSIGIGPPGSGTAYAAKLLFALPRIRDLGLRLSHHTVDEQMELLRTRKLDLGLFIIRDKSALIEKAVAEYGLEIAGLLQTESVSQRLPFFRPGVIPQGYYDPVRNIPGTEKKVLTVNTLLIAPLDARRSHITGILNIFSEIHPGLISYNRDKINWSGLPLAGAASDFFKNQGPEILDRYAPRLMDLVPVSGLVQILMGLSVLFNVLGFGNRFRLWRIDTARLSIEEDCAAFFGKPVSSDEMPRMDIRRDEGRETIERLIGRLEELEKKCRRQSRSFLVPMGREMSYRYQEEIIGRNLSGLRACLSSLRDQ